MTRSEGNRGAPRSGPFVDLERFRRDLREGGVEEMLEMLLDTFAQDCPGRMRALEGAVEKQDAGAIVSAAHAFKSGAVTIRADVLAGALSRVEEAARNGNLEVIPVLLEQIRTEQMGVMKELLVITRSINRDPSAQTDS